MSFNPITFYEGKHTTISLETGKQKAYWNRCAVVILLGPKVLPTLCMPTQSDKVGLNLSDNASNVISVELMFCFRAFTSQEGVVVNFARTGRLSHVPVRGIS